MGHMSSLEDSILSIISSVLQITRSHLREALCRIDGDGIEQRTKIRLHRRVYSVGAPHHIWHVDTNHKLIGWNFIVAGGIDVSVVLLCFLTA